MNRTFAIVYLVLLAAVLIWLFVTDPSSLLILPAVGLAIGVLIGGGALVGKVKDTVESWRYRRRMTRLLDGSDLDEVLEASPYDYGYVFQGDSFCQVWRKEEAGDFAYIHSCQTRADARMWIVEQSVREDPAGG